MKTQGFGIFAADGFHMMVNIVEHCSHPDRTRIHRLLRCSEDVYKEKRMNGWDADAPREKYRFKYPPEDGKYTWIKGRVEGDYVYGVKNAKGEYEYELRYDEGPGDRAWMEERDRNYLSRILKEGKLRELQPSVWCLREMDHAQETDIGAWWSQKLKLPDISTILERAEQDYKQFAAREAREAQEKEAAEKQRQEQAKDALEQEQREREERQRKQAEAKAASADKHTLSSANLELQEKGNGYYAAAKTAALTGDHKQALT